MSTNLIIIGVLVLGFIVWLIEGPSPPLEDEDDHVDTDPDAMHRDLFGEDE